MKNAPLIPNLPPPELLLHIPPSRVSVGAGFQSGFRRKRWFQAALADFSTTVLPNKSDNDNVLIISAIGAFMATDYLNLLNNQTRTSLNKIVFVVFTPSLIFASLVETVTFQDIISWWFMPINIGVTFLCGGILGWVAVKLIKPEPHLEGIIIAMCSTGNYANLLVIMVPGMCTDDGSPFGDRSVCKARGLSYASFSMALGSFYTWTCTYQMMQVSALRYNAMKKIEKLSNEENKDLDANQNTGPLNKEDHDHIDRIVPLSNLTNDDTENQCVSVLPLQLLHIEYQELSGNEEKKELFAHQLIEILKKIMEQLLSPPTLGSKGMKENEIVIDKQENEVKQDSSVSNVRVAANDFDDSVATDSDIRKQNVDFRKDIKGDEIIEFVVDDKDGGYSVEDICEQNVEGADMELDDNNCLVVIDKVCNKAGKVLTWSQMKSVKCSTCCKRKDRGWNKIVKTQCKVKCRRKSEMWKWPNKKKRRRKESWVKLVFCWNKDLYIRFVQWLDYLRQVTDVESRMAAYGPKRLGIRKKMLCNMLEGSNNVGKAKNVASNGGIHIEHKLYQMMLKDCDFERDCRSSFVEAPKA
ncbi:PIN-LIKES 7-like protein [Tanacetum coccineum]